MPHADFVHLRAHSAYSLSAGAIKVKELVGLCKKHGMPALALTDAGNLFGALEFAQAASEAGIQPIIGCELGLRRESDGRAIRIGPAPPPDSVVLLAQNERGYRNLLKLVSKSFLETAGGEPPQLDLAALEGSSDGLLLLTGGPAGPLGRLLLEGQGPAAEALLARLALLFPGRLYVELMRHGLAAEDRIEAALIDLAYAHDLPLVATNGVFFATAEFYEAHDVLLCIAEGTVVGEPNRRRLTQQHHFKAPAAMRLLFADVPEAIDNTLVTARRERIRARRSGEALSRAARLRARCHRQDGLLGIFPHRRGVHPVVEGSGHSRRAGARLGRGLGRRLVAHHHRSRPAALRPAVR